MCGTCGCSEGSKATVVDPETGEHTHIDADGRVFTHRHEHEHGHGQGHGHGHEHGDERGLSEAREGGATIRHGLGTTVELERRVLEKNDQLAERNRAWFAGREILALNLVSSPGAGKTALLERTILDRRGGAPMYVIEGDQQTMHDAERIRATGVPSVQINTGTGCHLEADMVMQGVRALKPSPKSVLMIENVGNLVCPALFDLGETAKVAILSVTEGEDKPVKYPHMFRASKLMILNKVDLLPYVDFDVDACLAYAYQVNPDIEVLQMSVRSGEGLAGWYDWLDRESARVSEGAFG